jgi:hypothetical protein
MTSVLALIALGGGLLEIGWQDLPGDEPWCG